MELSSHNNELRLRLMVKEAEAIHNLTTQLQLIFEEYFAAGEAFDEFAGTELGGSETAPANPALARLLPAAAEDEQQAMLFRMLTERALVAEHQERLAIVHEQLNAQLYSEERLTKNLADLTQAEFADLYDSFGEEKSTEEEKELPESKEAAAITRLLESVLEELDGENFISENTPRDQRMQIMRLISASHPILIKISLHEAIVWTRVLNIIRICLAVRITDGDTGSINQRLEDHEDEALVATYAWIGLLVESLSQALLKLHEIN